ncbi:hypothetical protein SAMN04490191_4559 [Pseudomonas lini]|uniref:Uncharacterized protein n=2 Tax=Pseudomonas lini TaxID=163011 RepID=A0A0L1NWA3_9PSED|nr:hypothetical protein ACS73_19490 [Pseudomonas lini]SDT46016.1 hypothetical protein SAMN04490191_4559 [Pseudomonas lini]
MIKIAAVSYTTSEVINMIKVDPTNKWSKEYAYYLTKISNSGGGNFLTYTALIAKLGEYCEAGKSDHKYSQFFITGPTANSALHQAAVSRGSIAATDRAPVNLLMTTGAVGVGVTNKSVHSTDPETGRAKGRGVVVHEYYINGASGRRVTARTESGKTTYYYSSSHAENTYKYALLT